MLFAKGIAVKCDQGGLASYLEVGETSPHTRMGTTILLDADIA